MTKITLTVACPEANRDDATHLAVALGWIEGWRPDEWSQSFTVQYQDAQGNLYRVMSCPVEESFIFRAAGGLGPIDRPPHDVGTLNPETGEYGAPYVVNLTGAHRAQSKLVTWQPSDPMQPVPQASPDRIVAVAGMAGVDALAEMGLVIPKVDYDLV